MVSEPYYLFHFLAFFSYIPVRCSASQFISPHFSSHLLHREIQAALAFSVLTVVKMVKVEAWEAFIADTLFFAKIFLVGIALVMDYHLALWYTLVFLGTWIIINLLGESRMHTFLKEMYIEGNAFRPGVKPIGVNNVLEVFDTEFLF
ncbi:unnamed protein product [Camellia sinensis]